MPLLDLHLHHHAAAYTVAYKQSTPSIFHLYCIPLVLFHLYCTAAPPSAAPAPQRNTTPAQLKPRARFQHRPFRS